MIETLKIAAASRIAFAVYAQDIGRLMERAGLSPEGSGLQTFLEAISGHLPELMNFDAALASVGEPRIAEIIQQARRAALGVQSLSADRDSVHIEPLLGRVSILDDEDRETDHLLRLHVLSPFGIAPSTKIDGGSLKDMAERLIGFIGLIPAGQRKYLATWLDHFDSAYLACAHSISAGVDANRNKPAISLYDYSRTVAALAVAILQAGPSDDLDLSAGNADNRFLLVQGEFSGIQEFVFRINKRATASIARMLRGRSFYVAAAAECAALRVLDDLGLPSPSMVMNAAGKFLIIAPNTPETIETLGELRRKFNDWSLRYTYGVTCMNLAWTPASGSDFLSITPDGKHFPFRSLLHRLFAELEKAKLQRFDMCGIAGGGGVLSEHRDRFAGAPAIDYFSGWLPAEGEAKFSWEDVAHPAARISMDQIHCGAALALDNFPLVSIRRADIPSSLEPGEVWTFEVDLELMIPLFGYRIGFHRTAATCNPAARVVDISLPVSEKAPLFNGIARRYFNGRIPRKSDGEPILLNALERLSVVDGKGRPGLMAIKGDIDDLGSIITQGVKATSFASMATLSRQISMFFTIIVPYLCQADAEAGGKVGLNNLYTVFAGGDDFFMLSPWSQAPGVAIALHKEFDRYVARNNQIHFSVGMSFFRAGEPLMDAAGNAEDALECAKSIPGKNAVACHGEVVPWAVFEASMAFSRKLAGELNDGKPETARFAQRLLKYGEDRYSPHDSRRLVWHARLMHDLINRGKNLQEISRLVIDDGMNTLQRGFLVAMRHFLPSLRSYTPDE